MSTSKMCVLRNCIQILVLLRICIFILQENKENQSEIHIDDQLSCSSIVELYNFGAVCNK